MIKDFLIFLEDITHSQYRYCTHCVLLVHWSQIQATQFSNKYTTNLTQLLHCTVLLSSLNVEGALRKIHFTRLLRQHTPSAISKFVSGLYDENDLFRWINLHVLIETTNVETVFHVQLWCRLCKMHVVFYIRDTVEQYASSRSRTD